MEANRLEAMANIGIDRIEKYETTLSVPLPLPSLFYERVFVGSFSRTLPDSGLRYLLTTRVGNLGWGNMTYSEMARDYLAVSYEKPRRMATAQYRATVAEFRSQPIYCRPCQLNDAVYFDLTSAYWNILLRGGWDVDYFPGRWLKAGTPPADYPAQHIKMARNILVSAGLPGRMIVWDGSKYIVRKTKNKLINLGLWAFVQDVLHGVAYDMLEIGAVYVNTDGYILPKSAYPYAVETLKKWGLPGRIKAEGQTTVYAVGSYRVGKYNTRSRGRSRRVVKKVADLEYRDWLRERMAKLTQYRLRDGLRLET